MNINSKKQSQFELFPGASKNSPEVGKSPCLTKDLTLSLENIIVLCIIFVMTLVLFFSFGVEKGKRVALLPGAENESGVVHVTKDATVKQSKDSAIQMQQGERVVFPVDVPQEITEESTPDFQPPLEKRDEQERLFTIQVASFKRKKNAQREASRLKGIGHDDAFVVPKGSYSIVCVGKFTQRDDAKKFSSRLRKKYNDCLIRRL